MNPKIEGLLELSIDTPKEVRDKIPDLGAYDTGDNRFEVVFRAVRYPEEFAALHPDVSITELLGGFYIAWLSPEEIEDLASYSQVLYIEKPRNMIEELYSSISVSCINQAKESFALGGPQLTGRGVLVGIVDTGIDITSDEFINEDNTTRILWYWNQEDNTFLDETMINSILAGEYEYDNQSGSNISHGQDVAVIAAGKSGVASESRLIVVKLSRLSGTGFLRSTSLMKGVDFCIRKAIEYSLPIAVNVSFGTNYGDHLGNSLLEQYFDTASFLYKCNICVGVGNEGEGRTHYYGELNSFDTFDIELGVGRFETGISFSLWKNYVDECDCFLISPSGIPRKMHRFVPGPIGEMEEFFGFIYSDSGYIEDGVWTIRIESGRILDGSFNIWLQDSSTIKRNTGFLRPSPDFTFTIPSTARRVISVGAYDVSLETVATFSGRGEVINNGLRLYSKPEIIAPGKDIFIESSKRIVSGTSYATPLVTGSIALMMEWGITRKNDLLMYGDRVKVMLEKGALRQDMAYPTVSTGFGRLCLYRSLF